MENEKKALEFLKNVLLKAEQKEEKTTAFTFITKDTAFDTQILDYCYGLCYLIHEVHGLDQIINRYSLIELLEKYKPIGKEDKGFWFFTIDSFSSQNVNVTKEEFERAIRERVEFLDRIIKDLT